MSEEPRSAALLDRAMRRLGVRLNPPPAGIRSNPAHRRAEGELEAALRARREATAALGRLMPRGQMPRYVNPSGATVWCMPHEEAAERWRRYAAEAGEPVAAAELRAQVAEIVAALPAESARVGIRK